MRYQISGKQIDIGESLQSHVSTRIDETVGKYPGRPTDANVVFSKSGHEYTCEAVVHLSTGLNVSAKGAAAEIYAAFDAANEKMDKQLRRYKRRLKDHHKERVTPVELMAAGSYILAPSEDDEDEAGETDANGWAPVIVAEMETQVPSLSVGEAVMQMELSHASVLVFRNEKHGQINVVHKRDDGNIGWIDPKVTS
ncbi:ribosome hibernation-promoting factor, HPF/YfiA family [Pseudoroseicyclus tamaricis]|uniref:Ribosome hibernation promoting factor n=1 Tax=Pseudoroseicyclus tamaricis TaxID=2705421 RepID=A0A6B2K2M9_9RHOB|nr:ribosome-associated translation inhibitor RaiA [Pseudoroseicyclus tamaricis]NDV02844.1 ribosome-associated translation inhibitor RaiA [Pseudoroseicyclus tamaricis]